MSTSVIHQVMAETQAGNLIFPEVVRRLSEIGVESYRVDFVSGSERFYFADGRTQTEAMTLSLDPVAEEFSSTGIVAAIRGAQNDTVRYPEFVKRAAAAGIIAYWVFITGRRAIYLSRKGELHIEEFPSARQ